LRRSILDSLNSASLQNAAYKKRLTETYARVKAALSLGFKEADDPDKKQADGSVLIKIAVDKKYSSQHMYEQPTLQKRREQDEVLADLIDQLKHLLSVRGFVCKETLSAYQSVGSGNKYSGGDMIYLHCTRVKLPSTKPRTRGSLDETPHY
jgi:hypothetical protein